MAEQRITTLETFLLLQLVVVAPLGLVGMVRSMAGLVSAVEAFDASSNVSVPADGGSLPFSGSAEVRLDQRHS